MKYHGLGRGLGALISKKINTDENKADSGSLKSGGAVFYIEIKKIHPNPQQPRKEFGEKELKELSNSIYEHGVLQPLLVSKIEQTTPSGIEVSYQLIAGERRLKAAQMAGFVEVPVIIKKANSRQNLEIAIVENVQREDLNPMERAMAYKKLLDEFNLTIQTVAEKVGKSREAVANLLRLLNLPREIQDAISSGQITEGHARAILMVKDQKEQMDLFHKILNLGLKVREVENIARRVGDGASARKIQEALSPQARFLVSRLEDALKTKVNFLPRAKGGKVVIECYSHDDLENIVSKICDLDTI